MEADKDTLTAARVACSDLGAAYAPRVVIEALLTLSGGVTPDHSLAERQETEGEGTTWRVVWLLEGVVLYVEAHSKARDWDLGSHVAAEAESITGWARPVREVSELGVYQVSPPGREFGTGWEWSAGTRVTFRDGAAFTLPLFGDLPTYRTGEAAEALLAGVQRQWLTSLR